MSPVRLFSPVHALSRPPESGTIPEYNDEGDDARDAEHVVEWYP